MKGEKEGKSSRKEESEERREEESPRDVRQGSIRSEEVCHQIERVEST